MLRVARRDLRGTTSTAGHDWVPSIDHLAAIDRWHQRGGAEAEVTAMSGFETFTRRLVPLSKNPRLTIQKRGAISLNSAAYVALGSPAAVELLFDRQRCVVGLRPVDPRCEHAYPVRPTGGHGSAPFVVSALAFLRYYEINRDASRRWDAYLDDGILCADVGAIGTPVTSNRAGP